ncbi:MAG TPA: hypothetical protein VJ770_00080 [Stellaceae bacterium]|nr:hypothetical protein [Stellaceae bacterium]
MPRGSNAGSGRAGAALRGAGPRPEPGTIPESLSEIREILHGLDRRVGDAPPRDGAGAFPRSTPAADEPGAASGGAVASPDPVPAPQAAPPLRRSVPAFAALAVAGVIGLGAAGLVAAGGPNLPDLVASASGKGQAPAGNRSEAVARAALPPAPIAASAKSDAVAPSKASPLPHIDMEPWQPPPAAGTGTALPAAAPSAKNRFDGRGHGRSPIGPAAVVVQGDTAALFAQRPAVPRQVGLVPAGRSAAATAEQSQRAHRSPHIAQNKAAPESRRGKPAHRDRLAHRSSPAIAGTETGPRPRREPARQPRETEVSSASRRWNRAAADPPAGMAGNDSGGSFAAAGQLADRNGGPRIYGGAEANPGPTAPGRADYAPAAAEPPRQPADWGDRGFAPRPRTVTVVDGFAPPFAPPPPPPPRFRYHLRAFPFAPPPRFRYGPGAGPPYPPPPFPYRSRFALP